MMGGKEMPPWKQCLEGMHPFKGLQRTGSYICKHLSTMHRSEMVKKLSKTFFMVCFHGRVREERSRWDRDLLRAKHHRRFSSISSSYQQLFLYPLRGEWIFPLPLETEISPIALYRTAMSLPVGTQRVGEKGYEAGDGEQCKWWSG